MLSSIETKFYTVKLNEPDLTVAFTHSKAMAAEAFDKQLDNELVKISYQDGEHKHLFKVTGILKN